LLGLLSSHAWKLVPDFSSTNVEAFTTPPIGTDIYPTRKIQVGHTDGTVANLLKTGLGNICGSSLQECPVDHDLVAREIRRILFL